MLPYIPVVTDSGRIVSYGAVQPSLDRATLVAKAVSTLTGQPCGVAVLVPHADGTGTYVMVRESLGRAVTDNRRMSC